MNQQEILAYKLKKISRVFNLEKLINAPTDIKTVSKYYKINILPYSIIYRGKDFIHMALTPPRSEYNRKTDVLNQVKIVEKYINKNSTKILELATGRGANSFYLAEKFPGIEFIGLDLPDGQIKFAHKKSKKLNNFKATEGDFHNLTEFKKDYFDIVFIFEAICHSNNKEKVLKEVNRILKPDGLFIIIDAFTKDGDLDDQEKIVKKLIEKGMVVHDFPSISEFEKKIDITKFEIIKKENLSEQIIPSLERLEKYSNWFFGFPIMIQKLIIKFFPTLFTNNAVSGYLIKDSIVLGLGKYLLYVLKKN